MPQTQPGSLNTSEYVAVIAYLLRLQGAAEGSEEIPADADALRGLGYQSLAMNGEIR
jgi:hypothetical protein